MELLRRAKEMDGEVLTKSGIMVGLGETKDELLASCGTWWMRGWTSSPIGQYLRPTLKHLPVVRYYTPAEFDELRRAGEAMGFRHVESGPLVRSSYRAHHQTETLGSITRPLGGEERRPNRKPRRGRPSADGRRRCTMATVWAVRPGRVPYEAARRWQQELVAARAAGRMPDLLILLEHPPTYTLGRAANPGHILMDEGERRRRGVTVHAVERGGDVTYHGPGQLVGYPIVDLRTRGQDVHRFLRDLEEVLIRVLDDFGIQGQRVPGLTGVWVGDEKVAAIGVAFRRWISYHGFALNVDPDLTFFHGIVPCGIADRGVTSMARLLGPEPPGTDVAARIVRRFSDVFGMEAVKTGRGRSAPPQSLLGRFGSRRMRSRPRLLPLKGDGRHPRPLLWREG